MESNRTMSYSRSVSDDLIKRRRGDSSSRIKKASLSWLKRAIAFGISSWKRHPWRSLLLIISALAGVMLVLFSCSLYMRFLSIEAKAPTWGPEHATTFDSARNSADVARTLSTTLSPTPLDWKRGPVAIFYNAFIPLTEDRSRVKDAIDVIKEQVAQIAASPISQQPVTLYYTMIGNARALNATAMQTLCSARTRKLTCTLLVEIETGSESVTLSRMQDFCIQYPAYRVTYLHTKGSFHVSEKNTNWRRLLTAAALAPECINPPNATCNMCGLQFFTQFTFFVPGNMYTASCDYVQKLLPFQDGMYVKAREVAVQEQLLLRLRNQLRSSLLWDQEDYMGLDRFADEHWIGSHPDLVPCDMDPIGNLTKAMQGILKQEEFQWAMGPRNSGICGGFNDHLQPVVRSDTDLSRREILFLPGLLVKWYSLYGQAPDPSSWVWSFFPDGPFWLQGVKRYGRNAVRVLTDTYRTSVDGSSIVTAFSSRSKNIMSSAQHAGVDNQRGRRRDMLSNSTLPLDAAKIPGHAVFYHIGVPNNADGTLRLGDEASQIFAVKDMIDTQLEIVSKSQVNNRPITLFYTVAGQGPLVEQDDSNSIPHFVADTCVSKQNLACRLLQTLDRNYEGETLLDVYRFCQRYPTYRVSYIHNQAPMQLRSMGGNDHLIRHLTMAATSNLCLSPTAINGTSCNVCGLVFHTLWTFFFPGNMFAASCEYVNRLLPPDQFEDRMREFVGLLLLRRLRTQVTTNLFPQRMDYFGLDRYAIDHWIGSHPSLLPCDLSNQQQDLVFWRQFHSSPAFNLSTNFIPRGIPFNLWPSNESIVSHNVGALRREAAYFAGHLFKWYTLYQKVPQPLSWQWWNLPEGLTWLKGHHEFEASVVDELVAKYLLVIP